MHIIHINFSITVGGIDTMLVDILNEQVKVARTTLIIINNKVHESVLKNLNNEVGVVKIGRRESAVDIIKLLKLNYKLKKLNPSIIHCHNSNVVNFLMFKICPRVLTVHDVNYGIKSYHKYDEIFAISNAVKNDIEQKGNFNTSLVYNGVNDILIPIKEEIKIEGIFRIVVISRLEHAKKGQDLVINALKILCDAYQIKNVYVDFIGDGLSKEYLESLSLEMGLKDKIRFLGSKSRNYIYENLKNYDLLIQPSRYEGFGLTIVEAMLAKVPVLAAAVDGPSEILNKGEYGYCFNKGDIDDLVKSMKLIMLNYEEVCNLILIKAYRHAKNNFSITKTSSNYILKYKKLIG